MFIFSLAGGPDLRTFNATIIDVNSNSAIVEVDLVSFEDFTLLMGYIYYYKEAPYRNVTKFDGRHGCGSDKWVQKSFIMFKPLR